MKNFVTDWLFDGGRFSPTNLNATFWTVFCQKSTKISNFSENFRKTQKTGRFARGERTIALNCHEVRWPLEGIGTVQNLFRSSDQVVRITADQSRRPDDKNPTGWLDGSGIAAANPGSIQSRPRFLRSPENSAVVSSPFPETPTSTPRSRLDRRRKRAGPGN